MSRALLDPAPYFSMKCPNPEPHNPLLNPTHKAGAASHSPQVLVMAAVDDLVARADVLFTRGGGLHPPSEVLVNWPKPNYADPEERGWGGTIAVILFMGIATVVFGARLWARLVLGKNAGLDDLLISMAMLPLLGLTISTVLGIEVYGFQWHAWEQTSETLVTTREITMAIELTYLVATTLTKISILCFYRRLAGTLTNTFVYSVWASMSFCVLYGTLYILLIIFACSPVVGFFRLFDVSWRLTNEVHCLNEGAIIVSCAIISTVQDFFICTLPVILIWNLKIPRRQKMALCGIFGIGLVTCVCGTLRTYYATYVYFCKFYFVCWWMIVDFLRTPMTLPALEADLAVICASVPALKIFFSKYLVGTTFGSSYSSGSRPAPSYGLKNRLPSSTQPSKQHSSTCNGMDDKGQQSDVPSHGIGIRKDLSVQVEVRDDLSQKSDDSTNELTSVPAFATEQWEDDREAGSVVSQLQDRSQPQSRDQHYDFDVESGTRTK